jgi:hypothetical protein
MGKKLDGITFHLRHKMNIHHTMCCGKVTETDTIDIFKKKSLTPISLRLSNML